MSRVLRSPQDIRRPSEHDSGRHDRHRVTVEVRVVPTGAFRWGAACPRESVGA